SIPIFDTTLVTFTRLREGRSPFQGGKDHTSHRIASMGVGQRYAVLTLYGIAAVMGILALVISRASVNFAGALAGGIGVFMVGAFGLMEWQYEKAKKQA